MNPCDYFDVTQLFTLGLGFDLAGAYLLARGLLITDEEIARRTGTYLGSNPWATVAEVEDRVDGWFGVRALLLGFALQVVAYAATLASDADTIGSYEKALVSVGTTAIGAVVTLVAARLLRPHWVKRALIRIASIDGGTGEPLDFPHGGKLHSYAKVLGYSLDEAEEDGLDFVRRVFGIKDAYFGEAPPFRLGTEMRREREEQEQAGGQPPS